MGWMASGMKHTEADYQRLLKQATSMMIALRDIVAVFDRINEILSWENLQGMNRNEAIRQARATTSDGMRAMENVLRGDALERPMDCGHERRFTIHEGRKRLCALCELSRLRCELSRVEGAEEAFQEAIGVDPETGLIE